MPVYTSWDQPAIEQPDHPFIGQVFVNWSDPVDILPVIITRDIPINYWGRNLEWGFLPSQLVFCIVENRQAVCSCLAHSSLLNLRCVSSFWHAHITLDARTYEPHPEPTTDDEQHSVSWVIN